MEIWNVFPVKSDFWILMWERNILVLSALENLSPKTWKFDFLNILCIFTYAMHIYEYIQNIYSTYLTMPIDPLLVWLSLTLERSNKSHVWSIRTWPIFMVSLHLLLRWALATGPWASKNVLIACFLLEELEGKRTSWGWKQGGILIVVQFSLWIRGWES